jgi:hypothetical protein
MPALQEGSKAKEILHDAEFVEVPPGAVGWVRMNFKGEKLGKVGLGARLWMDSKEAGKEAVLELRLVFYEPLRIRTSLPFGTLRDQELEAGVTQYILCWSSTRPSLDLTSKLAFSRGPKSDPFVLGAPEKLNDSDTAKLAKEINASGEHQDLLGGQVVCGYRIPVTLKAYASDGTPFDVGPFRRRVLVSSRDSAREPKSVLLSGRVNGIIDLGTDEEGGMIQFRVFPRSLGKRESIPLTSDVKDLELLEVDHKRTWSALKATIVSPKKGGEGLQVWTLRVEVKPDSVWGLFPRRDEATLEDCAVYLIAHVKGKTPQPVRIAVTGTATASER